MADCGGDTRVDYPVVELPRFGAIMLCRRGCDNCDLIRKLAQSGTPVFHVSCLCAEECVNRETNLTMAAQASAGCMTSMVGNFSSTRLFKYWLEPKPPTRKMPWINRQFQQHRNWKSRISTHRDRFSVLSLQLDCLDLLVDERKDVHDDGLEYSMKDLTG